LALSRMMNLTYIHHEFTPKNLISSRTWDQFLGFGSYFEDYGSLCVDRKLEGTSYKNYLVDECSQFVPCIKLVRVPRMESHDKNGMRNTIKKLMEENPECNTVFQLAIDQKVAFSLTPEEDPEGVLNFIRKAYHNARRKYPIHCYFDTSKLNVAIHIRRGDVSETRNTQDRFIPNSSLASLMKSLAKLLNQLDYQKELKRNGIEFHVYSEGKPSDFGELQQISNLYFHLNEDLFVSLHHLAMGDVLVGSYSGFSAYAKKIARGIPIYPFVLPENGVQLFPQNGTFSHDGFVSWWQKMKFSLLETPCVGLYS